MVVLVVVDEQLPRPHVPVVQPVQHHAHALGRRDQRRDAEHPQRRPQRPPAPPRAAQRRQDRPRRREQDAGGAEPAREGHARRVAVADGPADEVGVRLAPERVLDALRHGAQGGRVRRVGERLHDGLLLARGQVELAWCAVDDVGRDHAVDLGAEGLDRDCEA